ncbi:hypothetical protein R3P38DRAFT_2860734 [Favolaschia claudopus]|uniref:DUF6534 domain-containing protein n=1 Tax=Favolaschia claudopus TaxID=2862362 RepID=A0AAW0DQ05_9AGAR
MDSPLPPGVPLPKFDNTLGALLIGGLVATALYGITVLQTFAFFMNGTTDRTAHKALVAFLFVLDTFDTFLNGHILYFYLVSNYLAPQALAVPLWSVILHVAATSLSNFIVRSAFTRRIYQLSHGNIPGTLWIAALSVLDLGCGILITAKAFKLKSFLDITNGMILSFMYLDFAAGTSADLSVALALCYLLARSRTGFQRTDSLIRVLMMYTVNTGMLVALDATAGLVTFILMKKNFIFLAFYLLLSKLYLNSYLAILNARQGLREKLDEPKSIHLSRLPSMMQWRSGASYDPEGNRSNFQPALIDMKSDNSGSTMAVSSGDSKSGVEKGITEYVDPEESHIARAY